DCVPDASVSSPGPASRPCRQLPWCRQSGTRTLPMTHFVGTPSAPPPLRVDPTDAPAAAPAEGLAWFMALLQQAMTETITGEGTPLQKAGAIARLGNLYLKAQRSAELEQANTDLRRQTKRLEERLAAAEARLAALAQQSPAKRSLAGSTLVLDPDGDPGTADDDGLGSVGPDSAPTSPPPAGVPTLHDSGLGAAAETTVTWSRAVDGIPPDGDDDIPPHLTAADAGLPGGTVPVTPAARGTPASGGLSYPSL